LHLSGLLCRKQEKRTGERPVQPNKRRQWKKRDTPAQ
jgi:hypothetical protein